MYRLGDARPLHMAVSVEVPCCSPVIRLPSSWITLGSLLAKVDAEQKGHSEHVLDRYQSLSFLQGE
jgi:hypothetical protein